MVHRTHKPGDNLKGGLSNAIEGADVFIGVSGPGVSLSRSIFVR